MGTGPGKERREEKKWEPKINSSRTPSGGKNQREGAEKGIELSTAKLLRVS